jgi:hypothetical protein
VDGLVRGKRLRCEVKLEPRPVLAALALVLESDHSGRLLIGPGHGYATDSMAS